MVQVMLVGAATVTHSGSDDEEVRQKPLGPEVVALSRTEASVGGLCEGGSSAVRTVHGRGRSSTVMRESTGRPRVTLAEGVTKPE